jgi:hypothetical protein
MSSATVHKIPWFRYRPIRQHALWSYSPNPFRAENLMQNDAAAVCMFWTNPEVTVRPGLRKWLSRTELRLTSVLDRLHKPSSQVLTSHRRRSLVLTPLRRENHRPQTVSKFPDNFTRPRKVTVSSKTTYAAKSLFSISIDKKIITYLVDIPRNVSVVSAGINFLPAVAQLVEALC